MPMPPNRPSSVPQGVKEMFRKMQPAAQSFQPRAKAHMSPASTAPDPAARARQYTRMGKPAPQLLAAKINQQQAQARNQQSPLNMLLNTPTAPPPANRSYNPASGTSGPVGGPTQSEIADYKFNQWQQANRFAQNQLQDAINQAPEETSVMVRGNKTQYQLSLERQLEKQKFLMRQGMNANRFRQDQANNFI